MLREAASHLEMLNRQLDKLGWSSEKMLRFAGTNCDVQMIIDATEITCTEGI